jgi:hypothetical protein
MVRSVPYEVVRHLGDAELRRYNDLLLATVYDLADNDSFGLLFQYIGGENDKGSKVPMTAPVVSRTGEPTDPGSEGHLSFVLPPEMRMHDAPRPKDARVMLELKKGGLFAVMRFRGRAGEDDVQRMIHDLLMELREANFKVEGRPFLMRYNSPFTPGFMRHNEVAVRVTPP